MTQFLTNRPAGFSINSNVIMQKENHSPSGLIHLSPDFNTTPFTFKVFKPRSSATNDAASFRTHGADLIFLPAEISLNICE